MEDGKSMFRILLSWLLHPFLYCRSCMICYNFLTTQDRIKDRRTDRQMDVWMDGKTDRGMDRRTDGRTDEQTDKRMDGRTDGLTFLCKEEREASSKPCRRADPLSIHT